MEEGGIEKRRGERREGFLVSSAPVRATGGF